VDFSQALLKIKEGKKLQRACWKNSGMFIFLVPSSTFKVNRPPLLGIYSNGKEIHYEAHIDIRMENGHISNWAYRNVDVLATDWQEMPLYKDVSNGN